MRQPQPFVITSAQHHIDPEVEKSAHVVMFVCPKCMGTYTHIVNTQEATWMRMSLYSPGANLWSCTKCGHVDKTVQAGGTIMCHHTFDVNGPKVGINIYYKHYFLARYNEKLRIVIPETMRRYTFNVQTGMVYRFKDVRYSKRGIWSPKVRAENEHGIVASRTRLLNAGLSKQKQRIANITYNPDQVNLSMEQRNELGMLILDTMDRLGIKHKHNDITPEVDLGTLNKWPMLSNRAGTALAQMAYKLKHKGCKNWRGEKLAKAIRKCRLADSDPVGDILKAVKVPTHKSARSAVAIYGAAIAPMLAIAMRYQPNIDKVVSLLEQIVKDPQCLDGLNARYDERNSLGRVLEMIDAIGINGDLAARLIFTSLDESIFNRILRNYVDGKLMWDEMAEYGQVVEYKLGVDDLKDRFEHFHSLMTNHYNNLDRTKLVFDYKEIANRVGVKLPMERDFALPGATFKLPESSARLMEIGNELHHCVGSYANSVNRGSCLIVDMWLGPQRACCLELDVRRQKLVQAKGLYNNRHTQGRTTLEVTDKVVTFCREIGYDYQDCNDLYGADDLAF